MSRMTRFDEQGVTPRVSAAVTGARAGWAASACLFLLGVVSSCAPTELGRAGSPEAIARALARSTAVPARPINRDGRPLVYLALAGARGSRLAAVDIAQSKVLWSVPAPMTGRIVPGASVVVHAEGTTLVGRDLSTGTPLWRSVIPTDWTLVGYAAEGDTITYVARQGQALRGGAAELVAIGGRGGGVLWRRALGTSNVGGPAARGGIVAVPNRSQFISLFAERDGEPLGQVLSKEQAADFVQAFPEGFFYGFGADGFYLLSEETAVGVRSSPGHLQARLPKFVRQVYHRDMYRPELVPYGAFDRNRVVWRAAVNGTRPSFAGGLVPVMNYRFFFGFDAGSGDLRWAYSNPGVEAVAAAHTGRAIVFATANGEIGSLDPATGRRAYRLRLPDAGSELVTGATFDAEGYAPSGGEPGPAASLATTLSSIVWDPDRRFSEAQVFAVDQLARIPGREVTADLLKMLTAEELATPVIRHAARAVGERKDAESIDLFIAAIRVKGDYVTGTKASNLDVLARAVGAVGAKSAAEPLAAHLRLPETDTGTVAEIARALTAMQATETLPALRDYLTLYRADPGSQGDPSGLLAVMDALAKLGGDPEKELLLFVAEEPRTLPLVRERARHVLGQLAASKP